MPQQTPFFDYAAARKSGASDADIAHEVGAHVGFDTQAALKAGATPGQILDELSTRVRGIPGAPDPSENARLAGTSAGVTHATVAPPASRGIVGSQMAPDVDAPNAATGTLSLPEGQTEGGMTAGGVALGAVKGLGGASNQVFGVTPALAASVVPMAIDAARNALGSAKNTTEAQDWWFNNIVHPLVQNQQAFQPGHGFDEKLGHAVGGAVGVLSQAILTGGESLEPQVANQMQSMGQHVAERVTHGIKSMATPAISDMVNTGREVYDQTGDMGQSVKAALAQWQATSMAGAVPMGGEGALPFRMAASAIAGTAQGELTREGMNQVLPPSMQQPYSNENLALGGATGAILGIGGHNPAAHAEDAAHVSAAIQALDKAQSVDEMIGIATRESERPSAVMNSVAEQMKAIRPVQESSATAQQEASATEQAAPTGLVNRAMLALPHDPSLDSTQPTGVIRVNPAGEAVPETQGDLPRAPEPTPDRGVRVGNLPDRTVESPARGGEPARDAAGHVIQSSAPEPAIPTRAAPASTFLSDLKKAGGVSTDIAADILGARKDATRRFPGLFNGNGMNSDALVEWAHQNGYLTGEENSAEQHEQVADMIRSAARGEPVHTVANQESAAQATADARPYADLASRARSLGVDLRGKSWDQVQRDVEAVDQGAHLAATSPHNDLAEPTEGQKEAGNYKVGRMRIGGLDISVENPQGSTRSGTDAQGRPWSTTLESHYGYIRGSIGRDKDHVDAFVRPGTQDNYNGPVFVVDQVNPHTGAFDEHKAMIGWPDRQAAQTAYQANYDAHWPGSGAVTEMPFEQFKAWSQDHGATQHPANPEAVAERGAIMQESAPIHAEHTDNLMKGDVDALVHPTTSEAGLKGLGFNDEQIATLQNEAAANSAGRHADESGGTPAVPVESRASEGNQGQASRPALTSKPDWNAKRSAQEGAEAFARGESSIPPRVLGPRQSEAWVRGWHEANVKEPVPEWSAAENAARPSVQEAPASTKREQAPEANGYGAKNNIFTADAAASAREVLRKKLSQLSSGVDPEIIQAGLTLAGYHIEAGARSFADFTKAMVGDLGEKAKPYLRSWYESVRHYPGFESKGMDRGEDIERAAGPKIDDSTPAGRLDVANKVADRLMKDGYRNINEARAHYEELTGRQAKPGTLEAKRADEAIEFGVVRAARRIANGSGSDGEKFDQMVKLYGNQPNLNVRTSTSIEQQAYSTPAPLAFLASRLAGIGKNTKVFEPTAGNGMLLIGARRENITANELNPERHEALEVQGFRATQEDATKLSVPPRSQDAVIANPPFGPVKDANGRTVKHDVPSVAAPGGKYQTGEIDHAIALKSLEAMKDDGRAVLILGAPNKLSDQSNAYNGGAKRDFYYSLYKGYNVVDHFVVNGDLYSKQGAGWPVDVVVIDGRQPSQRALPAADVPTQFNSWDALKGKLDEADRLGTESSRPSVAVRNGSSGGRVPTDTAGSQAAGGAEGPGTTRPDTGAGSAADRAGPRGGRGGRADELGAEPGRNGRVPGGVPEAEPAGAGGADREAGDLSRTAEHDAAGVGRDDVRDLGGERGVDQRHEQETETQVHYQPASRLGNLGTLVPINMRDAVRDSLDALTQRVGNVDQFVAKELGYGSVSELSNHLAAEQVDAVALGIDNLKRGGGFIIGDQTGIGKGRVNAAIIRWAIRNKQTPIFVTEKANLYADMYRDLKAVGAGDVKILMTDANKEIPLDDAGHILKTPAAATWNAKLKQMVDENSLGGHQVIFTTYDSLNTRGGERTSRMDLVKHFGDNGILILDESHNAGGSTKGDEDRTELNRASYFRDLVGRSKGSFYSSATYAKRPSVMDLYSKTKMSEAVEHPSQLGPAIQAGGVPLQQVVASMLARAGQMIRRERTFAGIEYRTAEANVDHGHAEKAAEIMRGIMDFDKLKKGAVQRVNQELKASAKKVTEDGSTGGAGASSTNFTSLMHNVIGQMLLSLKLKAAAHEVNESLGRGEKPVLTLSNTMESMLDEFAEQHNINIGDHIPMHFGDLLERYLDRSRIVSERRPYQKGGASRTLSDEELGAEALDHFNGMKDMIRSHDWSDMPISPIDYLKNEVTKAGYKIGEITGRNAIVDYGAEYPTLRTRPGAERSVAGRRGTIQGFNNGDLDAVVLNRAGATGLSLHASPAEGRDLRQRHMIIAQPELNVDTHMQMLGRVNRTGQVVPPRYTQLAADIPAEIRPAAVLAKKMASLNANTTASRKSALTSEDTPDFLNDYGNEVVASIMDSDHDLHELLGKPLQLSDLDDQYDRADAAQKVTGRIPILPLDDQRKVYDQIAEDYKSLLDQKKALGENALEAQSLPLDAKQEKQVTLVQGTGDSEFQGPAYATQMDVKRLGKPYTSDQVVRLVRDTVGEPPMGGDKDTELSHLREVGRRNVSDTMQSVSRQYDAWLKGQTIDMEDRESGIFSSKANASMSKLRDMADNFPPGQTVELRNSAGGIMNGVVLNFERKGIAKNPAANGAWRVTVALADAAKQVTIPISRLTTGDELGLTRIRGVDSDWAGNKVLGTFDNGQTTLREKRTIINGNLLKAFGTVKDGQIVNYTTHEGRVEQGILMPKTFDTQKELDRQAAQAASYVTSNAAAQHFLSAGRGRFLTNDEASVKVVPYGDSYRISVAASKKEGAHIYLDNELRGITGDFAKLGSSMVAPLPKGAFDDAMRVLGRVAGRMKSVDPNARPMERVSTVRGPGVTRSEFRQTAVDHFGEPVVDALARANLLNFHDEAPAGSRAAAEYKPDDQSAHFYGSNLTKDTVVSTIYHEIGEHHGLKDMLGADEYDKLTDRLFMARKTGNEQVSQAWDAVRTSYKQFYGKTDGELTNNERFTHELIAKLGQDSASRNQTWYVRMAEGIKRFLRQTFGIGTVDSNEIGYLLHGSLQRAAREEVAEAPAGEGAMASIREDEPRSVPGAIDRLRESGPVRTVAGWANKVLDPIRMAVDPMEMGTDRAQAVTKDAANHIRLARDQWQRMDELITKKFTPAEQERMWSAADEENDLRRDGVDLEGMGIKTLTPEQRGVMDTLHKYGQELWERAKALGMVTGEGVHYWTPRMAALIDEAGNVSRIGGDGRGSNVVTSSSNLRGRKFDTTAESEEALRASQGDNATYVKNIRAMPLAMERMERAIAGRELISKIKEIGDSTGEDLVGTGKDGHQGWFTIPNHPAFKTYRNVVGEDGTTALERVPMYVTKEFEGPLKALLSEDSGKVYRALMTVKGEATRKIMFSPLVHNAVVFAKAMPAMPGKVITLRVYFDGNKAKKDTATRERAILNGLAPMGKFGGYQDITGIARGDVGENPGFTSKALSYAVGAIGGKEAGAAVQAALSKAGDFWHNTLLWNRVGDLQFGLYTNIERDLINKGMDYGSAGKVAAHFANLYAGSLTNESMSNAARKTANLLLFSRSFTLSNLGAMQAMVRGLPSDIQAQIQRDVGDLGLRVAQSAARRKAIGMVMADMALAYGMSAMLRAGIQAMQGQNLDEIMKGYADRFGRLVSQFNENPVSVLNPLHDADTLMPGGDNEPGRENRILVGPNDQGTMQYLRNPFGKTAEEMRMWATDPKQLLQNKESTLLRPALQTVTNDVGFGHKLWNESDSLAAKTGKVAWNFLSQQVPLDVMKSAGNMVTGQGDQMDAIKLVGAITGFSMSHGARGGPEVGLMSQVSREHAAKVGDVMPDAMSKIQQAARLEKNGDEAGSSKLYDEAVTQLRDVGLTNSQIRHRIMMATDPAAARMTPRAMRDFYRNATADEASQMQRLQEQEQ